VNFETFFRLISYAAVFCGFLALWVSGTFGPPITLSFVAILVAAWYLEDSRWQISERLGTALIVLALPGFYIAYRLNWIDVAAQDTVIAGVLARMILALSMVKLLQKKSDRDWVFLYLMAFFEVLLGAGLSISPLYLGTFLVYLLLMVCGIVAFEIRRASLEANKRISAVRDGELSTEPDRSAVKRLPRTAVVLLILIAVAAVPLFFVLPRVGGAGLGGSLRSLGASTGFSDSVRLGGIGQIQQNDDIVMRVQAEEDTPGLASSYFRGVALDRFDNRSWSKTRTATKETFLRGENGFIQIEPATPGAQPLLANVYLEPLGTPVIFTVPETLAVQANFSTLFRDSYGSLSAPWGSERSNYRFLSDTRSPSPLRLRADNEVYPENFRQYLDISSVEGDPRFRELTKAVIGNANNRYDKARAVESYLQANFGYTLEQKASGDTPLADFLFNVREGHCEYFASAMALMLRTEGIATRIVNGFRGGEYNSTVDTLIVRQRNAHSWVEVYFPGERTWATFDPTPGGTVGAEQQSGLTSTIGKYLEALDTVWIQYFVAFDNQEQRSLARSMRSEFGEFRATAAASLSVLQERLAEWAATLRGANGGKAAALTVGYIFGGIALLIGLFLLLRFGAKRLGLGGLWRNLFHGSSSSAKSIDFYERMTRILSDQGFRRAADQTPLEFASSSGFTEAEEITRAYNRVRFGNVPLSEAEKRRVEQWLASLAAR
jgi:protein-glutamine gamma-glutamyltransferase